LVILLRDPVHKAAGQAAENIESRTVKLQRLHRRISRKPAPASVRQLGAFRLASLIAQN
jgi:hypothetical protein